MIRSWRRTSLFHAPLIVAWLAVSYFGAIRFSSQASADAIEFNRDIRPLLSDHCFQCHGPDAAQRKADLRLDVEAVAKRDVDGRRPIAAGDLVASEVYRRLTSTDPDLRMPPPGSGKQLSPTQIERIGRWIADGAPWQPHWAFIPPRRPLLPPVKQQDWPRNPIDHFVLARIEAAGLAPSPEADRITLARRVTLDLTGLPPTPEEIDAFVADRSPDAYERLVDRLLASPRHGERMAARWLDAARYADTSGYQTDGVRHMWRWRDWVIDAFNRNLPFADFTIEQIAGDMLPGATLDQRIASGFNRNHRGNSEGGIIPEEYAVEYVIDRVDTTATVWLGLTMACARCHDHKFDPISQREFYQVFAFFNNVPEKGRAIKVGNSPPMIKAPTRDQQAQLALLEQQRATAQSAFAACQPRLAEEEAAWCAALASSEPIVWAPSQDLVAHFPLDHSTLETSSNKPGDTQGAVSYTAGTIGPAAAVFAGSSSIDAGDVARFGYFDKFTLAAWIRPDADQGTILARMSDATDADGYTLQLVDGKLQLNLVKRWLDDALRVETVATLASGQWHHVAVTYDGSRLATGVQMFVNGNLVEQRVLLDELNQTFASVEPLRIAGGGHGPKFRGLMDDVRIYKTDLAPAQIEMLATPETINTLAALPRAQLTARQAAKLRAYYLERHAPAEIRAARDRVVELDRQILEFTESFPTTMVMEEMSTPRETFVLARGQYDKPTDRVTADVPACLPPLPADAPRNRLSLARWLVSPDNPLTARVTVNRFWQAYFGAGLVKTVDDFGAQGDTLSHPELLDWLATEFWATGGDIKALQRTIVTSATYRQSAHATPAQLRHDPHNRLLARGPRLRLSAEAIRDSALAASGLLVERLGGPSVHPYQPPGLWKELTGGGDFVQDHGADLYRRGLYTFWKRTIAPPTMLTFDASGRESCSVRENRTNTPLQALTLMNEITFVEAARNLAQRAIAEGGATPETRITRAFRLVLGRAPDEQELGLLVANYERQRARFDADTGAAQKLLLVGESTSDATLDPAELAAHTVIANLILNLDEAITKE